MAKSIQVVSSNGESLLASDSRDGFLQATLNVSGANGLPSADDLWYTVFDTNNTALSTQNANGRSTHDGSLTDVAISLKRPPGGLLQQALFVLLLVL
jgi:hypothetical protein